MLQLLAAVAAVAVMVGCERAAGDAQAADGSTKVLAVLRRGEQWFAQGKGDPAALARVRSIIDRYEREGPDAFVGNPQIYAAAALYDPSAPGADRVFIHSVGPTVSLSRIEVLNARGDVVAATTDAFVHGTSARDRGAAVANTLAYLIPSAHWPMPDDVARAAAAKNNPAGSTPLELPPGWADDGLTVRLVYEDGRQTEPVPLFIDGDGPPTLVEGLKALSDNALLLARPNPHAPIDLSRPDPARRVIDAAVDDASEDACRFRDRPRLLRAAVLNDLLFHDVAAISLDVVGPAGEVRRVEILDATGEAVAVVDSPGALWKGVDRPCDVGLASILIGNVLPHPFSARPIEVVISDATAGAKRMGGTFDPLRLPDNWWDRKLSVRVVFDDERMTEALPLNVK